MLAALFDLAGQLIMRVLPLVVLFDLASGLSRLWLFFGFGTAAIGIGVAGAVTWHSATDPNGQQSKLDLATNAFLFWPHNFFFAVTYFVGANKDDYQSAQKALQHGQAAVSAVPQLSLPRPPGAWVRGLGLGLGLGLLTALASCGGLVRLLAALRTSAARTPQFGSALCFRQPVPQSPRSLSLSDHAGTALQLMGKYRESVSHPGLEPQADEQRGPGGPAPHAFGPCLRQEKIYLCSRPSYILHIYMHTYGTGGAL